jgi:hypothetical protein
MNFASAIRTSSAAEGADLRVSQYDWDRLSQERWQMAAEDWRPPRLRVTCACSRVLSNWRQKMPGEFDPQHWRDRAKEARVKADQMDGGPPGKAQIAWPRGFL